MNEPTLEDRVRALEAMAHPAVDVTALALQLAEALARTLEADPHAFSSRPCPTCCTASGVLGRPFGCMRGRS